MVKKRTLLGYRRENGRVGVRNHVIILPVDDISNAACEAVANNIKGTLALPHAYGRLQFGEDLELHFRTMIGTGSNANVAAVVVIGIESGWTQRIVDGIAKTGKPVKGFWIEGKGDIQTIAEASRQAKEYVQWASELQRTECGLEELYISVKCGESDTTTGLSSCPTVGNVIDKHCALGGSASFGETSELTGAEHIVAAKAATDEVRRQFIEAFEDYTKLVFDQKTNDLSESQPTKGNIAGGLTTIEEKALGNVEKLGKKTNFVGCLKPAAAPDENKFDDRVNWMLARLKANKLRPGAERILIPGERSARTAAENQEIGVSLGPETVVELEKWCQQFGVAFNADAAGI
jgi:(2R)-sulfolactate sulfo-lyase subunit beta